jgi:putative acetyltransferase
MPAPELLIRRAAPDDAAAIARMYGEREVQSNLLQLPWPSVEGTRQWLAERQARGRADIHLVAERGGEVVGLAGLDVVSTQLRRRHVMGLGMAVASAAQRQGVGTALMTALMDYADGWAQVLRIELTVYTDNAAAIALYQRFGFRIEGTHRGYAMRDGGFADVHAMARLHPDPPRLMWPAPGGADGAWAAGEAGAGGGAGEPGAGR